MPVATCIAKDGSRGWKKKTQLEIVKLEMCPSMQNHSGLNALTAQTMKWEEKVQLAVAILAGVPRNGLSVALLH